MSYSLLSVTYIAAAALFIMSLGGLSRQETARRGNLYGIVGANHAHMAGFNYSNAFKALADKPWTDEDMNAFIAAPARAIAGTRMAFAGLGNVGQRADIIAYLRSISPRAPEPK